MNRYLVPLFCIFTVLLTLQTCKLDTSSHKTGLLAVMKGSERLFFRENLAAIQLQENLPEIARESARLGYINVMKYLRSINPELNGSNAGGWNTFLYACERGDIGFIRYLVEQAGADIRSKTAQGLSGLMLAAKNGKLEVCRYLLDRGAYINARTDYDASVFMYAVSSGNPNLIALFVERGASLHVLDRSGANAADYAPDSATLSYLESLGLKPNQP